jgi:hypothetical protein
VSSDAISDPTAVRTKTQRVSALLLSFADLAFITFLTGRSSWVLRRARSPCFPIEIRPATEIHWSVARSGVSFLLELVSSP